MPDYNDTTVAQTFPSSSSQPRRLGRSREGSLESSSSPRPHRPTRSHEGSLSDASSPRSRQSDRSIANAPAELRSPRPRRLDRSRERYPRNGSLDEVYVERKHVSRDTKGHLAIRHDQLIGEPRRSSRSPNPPRRQVAFRNEYKYKSDDSESDTEHRRSRAVTRRNQDNRLRIVPCSEQCNDNPHKATSQQNARSYDDDSDSGYDSGEEADKSAKHRNRKLLYTGLATITTIGAANGIYQNAKAYHTRHNDVHEGEKCTSEIQRLKKNALLMDLFTAGVVAIGLNNVRLGWQRLENVKKEGKEMEGRR